METSFHLGMYKQQMQHLNVHESEAMGMNIHELHFPDLDCLLSVGYWKSSGCIMQTHKYVRQQTARGSALMPLCKASKLTIFTSANLVNLYGHASLHVRWTLI